MKYALLFAVLGVVCPALGLALGGPVAIGITAWIGVACLGLAVAYAGAGPGVLGKSNGRIALWSYLAFAPFHILNHALFHAVRVLNQPPFHQIVPNVYLGRRLTAREASAKDTPRFAAVLDLTSEFTEPAVLREAPGYRCIPLLDATAPTEAMLADGVDHMRSGLGHEPVLVHCAMGHGRSAVFVAAYLVQELKLPPDEAESRCNQRPGVKLNPAQRRALAPFTEENTRRANG